MKTRGNGIVGYNVQTAVDTENHLIVAQKITNVGTDRDQLAPMAERAREALGMEQLPRSPKSHPYSFWLQLIVLSEIREACFLLYNRLGRSSSA